jgi:tetratricopeptide (TPR) repeat protein
VPKRKISPKELKRPDQFVDFWSRTSAAVSNYTSSHMRALVVSITALATVVAGSIALSQVSERRSIKAAEALDRVQRMANAELATPGATPPTDDGIPHLPTEKEQLQAALKELDGSFSGPHGTLHAEAMLVRGSLLLNLDRAAEAVTNYQTLLADNLDGRLHFLAQEGLGYGYERLGKLEEAQAAFVKLGADASASGQSGQSGLEGFYKDRALFHQARIAELRSNPADAARLYHEVLDKNPTTSLREEITNRLASLEMK